MLAIISPAKTLDYESELATRKYSIPQFETESRALINGLRKLSPQDIGQLMNLSDKLAELNHRRYAEWQPDYPADAARPAMLAFKGDVYLGLDGPSLGERDFTWAQKHVRILSGLHGLLRPLDRIRPYRLEMGTRLPNKRGKDLYAFWGDRITDALNEALLEQKSAKEKTPLLINLASNEYFNAIDPEKINGRIIDVGFKELRDGKYRFLSFFAKKARGTMVRYMIDKRVNTLAALRRFDYDGYSFNDSLSEGDRWVFTRPSQ